MSSKVVKNEVPNSSVVRRMIHSLGTYLESWERRDQGPCLELSSFLNEVGASIASLFDPEILGGRGVLVPHFRCGFLEVEMV